MKPPRRKLQVLSPSLLFITLCASFVPFLGCGDSSYNASEEGSVAFQVAFDVDALDNVGQGDGTELNCCCLNVVSIEAEVFDDTKSLLAKGGPWPCEQGEGTITGVEAGEDRKLILIGRNDAGADVMIGIATVTVVAGKTADTGVITLWPTVERWAKTYDPGGFASSIAQTTDPGYVVAFTTGSNDEESIVVGILKLKVDGDVDWAKIYSDTSSDWASDIQQTEDGGYVLAGLANYDVWIVKLHSDGELEWQNTYGSTCTDDLTDTESCLSIQQTEDKGYIVAGWTCEWNTVWVMKLTQDGTVQWRNTYAGISYFGVAAIQQTEDGGYVVAGANHTNNRESLGLGILKLKINGDVDWAKTYRGAVGASAMASSIHQTEDEGYLVAGGEGEFGESWNDLVLKLDADGKVDWAKIYMISTGASSTQQTRDGGYAVFGGHGMLKLNAEGNVEWVKTWGTSGEAYSMQQTTDGGYVAAGWGGDGEQVGLQVLKLDASGEIPGCSAISTRYVIAQDVEVTDQDAAVEAQDTTVSPKQTDASPAEWSPEVSEICAYSPDNCPPILDPIGTNLDPVGIATVNEGESLELTITASDYDEDALIYSVENMPEGWSLDSDPQDPEKRIFTWKLGILEKAEPEHYYPVFRVTDSGSPQLTDAEQITITVNPTNLAPEFDPVDNQRVTQCGELKLQVTATDPDEDDLDLTYGADLSLLPDGHSAVFDSESRTFIWCIDSFVPNDDHNVSFTVNDHGIPSRNDYEFIFIRVDIDQCQPEVSVVADPDSILANGESRSVITATVRTICGNDAPDGTVVTFSTTLGSFEGTSEDIAQVETTNGMASAQLVSLQLETEETATVTATVDGATASTSVTFTVSLDLTILEAIWGSSPNDVFAVGNNGTILRYDGTTWSEIRSGPYLPLRAIWGSSPNDVFAVGNNGTILRYDGTTWSETRSGPYLPLRAIWGSSPNDVFAVGGNATILHYDGTGWSEMSVSTWDHFDGVWGSSGSDVFAVGGKTILHYDGASWSKVWSGTYDESGLRAVWGSSGNDVFAVASRNSPQDSNILHYDGTGWSEMWRGTSVWLEDVWGGSGNDVFAVGCGYEPLRSIILHYDGTGWSEMDTGTLQPVWGIWGSSGNDVYAVAGTILHYDGANWSRMTW